MEKRAITIDAPDEPLTLRSLLLAVVSQQVDEYNGKTPEKNLLAFLTESEIQQRAESGKVGFNTVYNENKANKTSAQRTALQAFEDGMFVVFADEEELGSLDARFSVTDQTVFTFIRLTFLTGGFY